MTPDDMDEHLEAVARALGDGDFTRVTFPEGVAKKTATAIRALLLDYQSRGREIEKLRGAISWLDQPFIDESTSESELRTRIAFMLVDRDRAALKGKSQ
jgi:hypothetical protein